MIKTKKYNIQKWTEWHNTISISVDDFHTQYGLYPNILSSNDHTFSQIDYMINIIPGAKKNVFEVDDITQERSQVQQGEYLEINSYSADDFVVTFVVDNDLKDKSIVLMYDDSPDWDDEDDELDPPDMPSEILELLEVEVVDNVT